MRRLLPTMALLLVVSTAHGQFRNQQGRVYVQRPVVQQQVIQNGQTPDWAKKLFDKDKIDFGVIATGSESKKIVRVKNVLKQTVHIRSAGTTCGCSVATPSKQLLQPGEEATIEVTMNTVKFKRRKDSNVIITLDAPQLATVRIPITAYIRTDVVFDPGMVRFGSVGYKKASARKIRVAYAGRNDWTIKELKVGSPHLTADFMETRRANGRVDYTLDINLKPTAPVGRLRDLITLVTDDQANPFVPLLVEANIEPDFLVTPGMVSLGRVNAGQSIVKQIVVRGKQPFEVEKIVAANGETAEAQGVTYRRPNTKKPVQVVPISITAPDAAGRFTREFEVWIVGHSEPVKFKISGEIAARLTSNK